LNLALVPVVLVVIASHGRQGNARQAAHDRHCEHYLARPGQHNAFDRLENALGLRDRACVLNFHGFLSLLFGLSLFPEFLSRQAY
jgi:hypothetical protein